MYFFARNDAILVTMMIKEITNNKKQYLSLLLLADEQESMVDKYLNRGKMYVLFEDNIGHFRMRRHR